jgi:hypothetical protein
MTLADLRRETMRSDGDANEKARWRRGRGGELVVVCLVCQLLTVHCELKTNIKLRILDTVDCASAFLPCFMSTLVKRSNVGSTLGGRLEGE